MSQKKPTLNDVYSDLQLILLSTVSESGGPISYSTLSEELSNLTFPPTTYLRFLSDEGFIEIDRVEDTVKLTEAGITATNDSFKLHARAEKVFTERLHSLKADGSTDTAPPKLSQNDQYERIEELGSGGIGTVYLAHQKPLNRKVAIKEIREIFSVFAGVQRSDIIGKFRQVIHAQAALDHPNIIQLIDLVLDGEYPYVVMAYANNGNLRRLISAEKRPPLEVALKYFIQILHAFNCAHQNHIFHGAVKPENIVLDSAGNALITDFGMTLVADIDSNKGNQVYVGVGTVAYMSPEQFVHPNKTSAGSDIYSLGILLYEMLTGKMPGRRSPMPSSFYPDIPRKLDDIFDKMSMDDPKERYQSIEDILIDIYSCNDIMQILDKRTGFQFLRDPLTYGPIGLEQLEGLEPSIEYNQAIPTHYNQPKIEEDSIPSLIEHEASHGNSRGNTNLHIQAIETERSAPQRLTPPKDTNIYNASSTSTEHTSEAHAPYDFSDLDPPTPPIEPTKSVAAQNDIIGKLDRYSGMFNDVSNGEYISEYEEK